MKISRRNFLKGSETLFLAGFNFPVLANTDNKKKSCCYNVKRRNGWFMCSSNNW